MVKVSIILPSYNHSEFLLERLKSIHNQTYKNWEAIIIDDQSTDDSVPIISSFLGQNTDFKVKYFIVNEKNSGSGYFSWQKGIELADTEYIWIAETDDYSSINFLDKMINVLENNPQIALAFCDSNYVDKNKEYLYDSSKRTSVLKVAIEEFGIFNNKILLNSMPLNPLITNGSSVVFRKPLTEIPIEIFQQKQLSDLFLWSYLVKNKDFSFLNKKLNFFRRHEGSTTTKNQLLYKQVLFDEIIFYSNYFRVSKEKLKAVIYYFVQNSTFSMNALKKIEGFNQREITYYYVNSSCKIFIKKIIKSLCQLYR
ncbi:glycosyltransferase [Flavobacterium sp. TR2]|uniref:glycosyltransferase family 2 protein n=1 Tax=Flavobacterium sp. TR2 TaxID=2977321 RepID=UPI0021B115AC|nr:glycosyltransferase [Flavobacterium sp. TR2]UWY28610.1 glycosyltransferase [Flavobacterium sp. TR2]